MKVYVQSMGGSQSCTKAERAFDILDVRGFYSTRIFVLSDAKVSFDRLIETGRASSINRMRRQNSERGILQGFIRVTKSLSLSSTVPVKHLVHAAEELEEV